MHLKGRRGAIAMATTQLPAQPTPSRRPQLLRFDRDGSLILTTLTRLVIALVDLALDWDYRSTRIGPDMAASLLGAAYVRSCQGGSRCGSFALPQICIDSILPHSYLNRVNITETSVGESHRPRRDLRLLGGRHGSSR